MRTVTGIWGFGVLEMGAGMFKGMTDRRKGGRATEDARTGRVGREFMLRFWAASEPSLDAL